MRAWLRAPLAGVVDFLQEGMQGIAGMMAFAPTLTRSSTLDIDPALRGQSRVIAIARAVGATHYLNPPGGRALYDATDFHAAGLKLQFLSPYEGRFRQLLPALVEDTADALRRDVIETLQVEDA